MKQKLFPRLINLRFFEQTPAELVPRQEYVKRKHIGEAKYRKVKELEG